MVRSLLQSSEQQLLFRVPETIVSTVSTFLKKSSTNDFNKTELLPYLKRVEYYVNGTDSYIKFPLTSEEEIDLNYIRALNKRFKEL